MADGPRPPEASQRSTFRSQYTQSTTSIPQSEAFAPSSGLGTSGGSVEPYPAWTTERQVPLSTEEIEDILYDLTMRFGFQRESMRNVVSWKPSPECSSALIGRFFSLTSSCSCWTAARPV